MNHQPDKRVNNAGTESFHAQFIEQFYSAHHTMFIFTDVLRKAQAATDIKMRNMANHAPMRRIEKNKICFLMEQYGKFQANVISRYNFIKIVGYRFSARRFINFRNRFYLLISTVLFDFYKSTCI